MVKLYDEGIYLVNGTEIVLESEAAKVQALTGKAANKEEAKKGTMACSILSAHNTSGDMEHLKLKFDAMASHDITFVGIVQTAKASGRILSKDSPIARRSFRGPVISVSCLSVYLRYLSSSAST